MTDDDKKNIEILDGMFERNFDFDPKSIDFAKKWLREPQLDPKFAAVVGDDFRARWDIPVEKFGESKDTAWVMFKNYFSNTAVQVNNISYQDFLSNTCKVGKDTVKISKVLDKFFKANPSTYKDNIRRYGPAIFKDLKVPVDVSAMIAETDEKKIHEGIANYITRANEKIGQIKAPKDQAGYQVVLSFNFADWLLASTGDGFSSCIGLDSSHGYWYGLPFMLDDRNRGFLYITKKAGEKKEYLGLKADHLSNREWVFLADDDTLHGYRWYPKETPVELSMPMLSALTGFSISSDGFNKSKYPLGENLHIKGTDVFCTPYLDSVGVSQEKGKYFYSTKNGSSGANVFGNKPSSLRHTYNGEVLFKTLYKSGLGVIEAREYSVCQECSIKVKKGSGSNLLEVRDNEGNRQWVCRTCYDKKYAKCEECGGTHSKEELKKTKEYKGNGICQPCFSSVYIKCESCGEFSLARESKNNLCKKCIADTAKVVSCLYTNDFIAKKKAFVVYNKDYNMYFKDADSYGFFAEEESLNAKDFTTCGTCGEVSHKAILIHEYTGSVMCRKCADKLSSKKQMWLDFSVPKKVKKEKAVKAG